MEFYQIKKTINVFIASSNTHLSEDREYFTRIFEDINANILPHLNFEPKRWKENLESGSFDGNNVQDIIDAELFGSCEIIFVIVYSKIGKYTKYEFNRALRDGKKVFLYFKRGFSPSDAESAEEYAKVFKFKEKAQNQGVILSEYGTKDDLQKEVQKDIILFARDQYPNEDVSVVKMFSVVKETITQEDLDKIKYFLILPTGFYRLQDLFAWFKLTLPETETVKKSFELLLSKGILAEKGGSYGIHPAIKNLYENDAWEKHSDCISKILDTFRESIEVYPPVQDVSHYQLRIKVIEDFINSKAFQFAKDTFEFRKSLIDYYIGTCIPKNIAKAEKLITSYEVASNDNEYHIIEYTYYISKVYYEMYLMMRDTENELYDGEAIHYLQKAKYRFDSLRIALPPLGDANILKMQVTFAIGVDYEHLKNDFEDLWLKFDGEFNVDDRGKNIKILEKHLNLSNSLYVNENIVKKIYENIILLQKKMSGPLSPGYIYRCIKFGQYLKSKHGDGSEQLRSIIEEITPLIAHIDPKNVNIRDEYINLITPNKKPL